MLISQLIRKAIDTAVAGTSADGNVLQSLRLEAEILAEQALRDLARDIAGNFDLRARLEMSFNIVLTDGVGDIPDLMLTEYLDEGSVRDSDFTAATGFGNILERVQHYNDFLGPLTPVYGYYCLAGNKIYTRTINTSSFISTVSPLVVIAPFNPTKADMNTQVPAELEDDLVVILAEKIRGQISHPPVPVGKQ